MSNSSELSSKEYHSGWMLLISLFVILSESKKLIQLVIVIYV